MNRDLFIADLKQMSRFYSADDLPAKVADYIEKRFIERIFREGRTKVHKDVVIGLCCQYFEVRLEDMVTPSRVEEIRLKRQKTIYLLRCFTRLSTIGIGNLFNRDHTTIIASCRGIEDLMDTDPGIQKEIALLSRLLSPQPHEYTKQN
jgi:chromosomal replication initiation ATPase DnaA